MLNAYQKRLAQRQQLHAEKVRIKRDIRTADGWARCNRYDSVMAMCADTGLSSTVKPLIYRNGWYYTDTTRYSAAQIDSCIEKLECLLHMRENPQLEQEDD